MSWALVLKSMECDNVIYEQVEYNGSVLKLSQTVCVIRFMTGFGAYTNLSSNTSGVRCSVRVKPLPY